MYSVLRSFLWNWSFYETGKRIAPFAKCPFRELIEQRQLCFCCMHLQLERDIDSGNAIEWCPGRVCWANENDSSDRRPYAEAPCLAGSSYAILTASESSIQNRIVFLCLRPQKRSVSAKPRCFLFISFAPSTHVRKIILQADSNFMIKRHHNHHHNHHFRSSITSTFAT